MKSPINDSDLKRICASVNIICTAFTAGIIMGVTCATMADYSAATQRDVASLGGFFACRGVGGLLGVVITSWVSKLNSRLPAKQWLCATYIMCSGLMSWIAVLVMGNSSWQLYTLWMVFLLQGIGIGAVSLLSTILLLQMWGQRSRSWSIARVLFWNAGGLFAFALRMRFDVLTAHAITAVMALLPAICSAAEIFIVAMHQGSVRECAEDVSLCVWITAYEASLEAPESVAMKSLLEAMTCTVAEEEQLYERTDDYMENLGRLQLPSLQEEIAAQINREKAADRKAAVNDILSNRNAPSQGKISVDRYFKAQQGGALTDGDMRRNSALTLTYAGLGVTDLLCTREETGIQLCPMNVYYALANFAGWSVGLLLLFGCWITQYELDLGRSPHVRGYFAMIYLGSCTLGCFLSIGLQCFVSSSTMLRLQLLLISASSVLMLLLMRSYLFSVVAIAIFGLSIGSINVHVLYISGDYGCTM